MVGEDHCLSHHSPHLGATDVKHVAMGGEKFQIIVARCSRKAIAKACSVNVKQEIVFFAGSIQSRQFVACVHHSEFGGHGDINKSWLHHVRIGVIAEKAFHILREHFRRHFAVFPLQRNHLMSESLNGSGFVDFDMPSVDGQCAFAAHQQGINDHRIGLRAAHEESHVSIFNAHGLSDFLFCRNGVDIKAVTAAFLFVRLGKTLQDFRQHAVVIVAFK